MSHHPHHDRDRHSASPPTEGDIYEGEIVRIESYGAFCSLLGTRWQGLIHISQLYESRVERVEDVVSLNDRVWVKVLQVETSAPSNNEHHDRPRLRIKLSMKDVSQDGSRQDLGQEREQKEQVKNQLESSLNSMIGMGVARDPMENRLVIKGNAASSKSNMTFRGGYTLVGDDEGEPEPTEVDARQKSTLTETPRAVAPMGRGRGTTLPAWMTRGDGLSKAKEDEKVDQSDSDSSERHHDRKKRKKKHHKKSSKSKKERKDRKSRKKHHKRRRGDDSDDDSSRSSFDDRERHRRSEKRKRKKRRRSNSAESSTFSDASSAIDKTGGRRD
ncbi:MAG: hypothetical protein SGILL_000539 [Bacillariaceae sp.]